MTDGRLELSCSDVNELLERYPLDNCWNANHYLGSMFILDFGERLLVNRRHGSVLVGGSALSVRNVFWTVKQHGRPLATANEIDGAQFANVVRPLLVGGSLLSLDAVAQPAAVVFHFSDAVDLLVDSTDVWKSEDVLVEVTLRNGQFLQLMPGGMWTSNGDRDLLRKQAFESK